MKDKLINSSKSYLMDNKMKAMLAFLGTLSILVVWLYSLPLALGTEWKDNSQAYNAIAWVGVPAIVGGICIYQLFKAWINTAAVAVRRGFLFLSFISFALLYNPAPFNSCYYDILVNKLKNDEVLTNGFMAIGVILAALSVLVFVVLTRMMGRWGTIAALAVNCILMVLAFRAGFMGLSASNPDSYKLAVFLMLWGVMISGILVATVRRKLNVRGSEDSDTDSGDH